jgi:hypothetical protein
LFFGFGRETSRTSSLPDYIQNMQKKRKKVIMMVDLSTKTIKEIFNKQVRELTKRTLSTESFDYQFSDRWIGTYA